MNTEKIISTLEIYRDKLKGQGAISVEYPCGKMLRSLHDALNHCLGLIDRIGVLVEAGRTEGTIFSGIHFIQVCLWISRIYTLEELNEHNRSME